MRFLFEKIRINIELGIQIEAAQIKHLRQRHLTKMNRFLRCARVHVLEAVHQRIHFILGHQIGLADEYLVSEADLTSGFLALIQLGLGMFGVHQGQNRVQHITFGNLVVHDESLGHRAGVGQPSGLNHDAIKIEIPLAPFLCQVPQRDTQVLANGAANAAIAHLDDLLFGVREQDVAVDVFLTELVFDHRDFLAMGIF